MAIQSLCITTVAMCTLMVLIGTGKIWGMLLLSSSVKAVVKDDSYKNTLQANMDTVLKLQPEILEKQSTQERLDILQAICNIEINYLGLPTPISVEFDNLPEATIGVYSDGLKLIQINLDYIENAKTRPLKIVWHVCFMRYIIPLNIDCRTYFMRSSQRCKICDYFRMQRIMQMNWRIIPIPEKIIRNIFLNVSR